LAADLKSISLSLAVMAGFTLLAGAAIPYAPGRAQEQSTVPPNTSPGLVEKTLIARGNALLEAGDFDSARLLYQAAANQGSAQAAMLTGVTFDPRFRELSGISGTQSNAKLARQWYALAMRRGDTYARRNDLELVKWLKDQNMDPDALAEPAPEAASEARPEPEPEPEPEPDQEALAEAEPHQGEDETTVVDAPSPPPVARREDQSPLSAMAPAPNPGIETASQPEPGPAEVEEENAGPDTTPASAEPPGAAAPEAAAEPSTEVPVVDARVARAQLTSAVKDREPVDRLPSSIQVSDGRLARIVFFSEVRDLAGQTLSHRWEHRGETVAEVSFIIGSDTWRMHSAKRVTAAMTGEWRVVVVDEVGTELASVPFVLE